MEALRKILAKSDFTELTSSMTEQERMELNAKGFNEAAGVLNEQDGYNCGKCRNKGMIMRAVERNGQWSTVARDCKCMKVRNCIRLMKRSGLKDIIKDYTFDKYEAPEPWQQAIKAAAMEYAGTLDGWFFIGGQSGAGKTHICTAICREFLLAGKEVVYMLWRDDAVKLKALTNEAEQREEMLNRFKRAEILYIDDLFKTGKAPDGDKQRPTVGDVNLAFEILNFRYNEKLPTVISSECTVDDLLDIDEATAGRIIEKSKAVNLKPDRSRNYRLKGVIEL